MHEKMTLALLALSLLACTAVHSLWREVTARSQFSDKALMLHGQNESCVDRALAQGTVNMSWKGIRMAPLVAYIDGGGAVKRISRHNRRTVTLPKWDIKQH